MLALRLGKRLQGVLPHWLRAAPACSATTVEDCLSVTGATLIDSLSTPYMFNSRTRTLTSASLSEDRVDESSWEALDDQIPDEVAQLETAVSVGVPKTVLNLPQSIAEIGRLNPELREAMEASASFAR